MMWVLRAGKNSKYFNDFITHGRIYMCWDGYDADLSAFSEHKQFFELVSHEPDNTKLFGIINRCSQLECFANGINIGDLVLVPSYHSKYYALGKVIGAYEYGATKNFFPHSRKVEFLLMDINRDIFDRRIQYSLGAYRTLFHTKHEDFILAMIKKNYPDKEWR